MATSYCHWQNASALDRAYHDTEWGIPVHDDRVQFEYLLLEVMQCGLSWELMLRKREVFRRVFSGFDADAIAAYSEEDVARILNTPGMIRSERKVRAIISNARCFRALRAEHGSFAAWLWGRCGGRTILYAGHAEGHMPASNRLSAELSRELKKRGFKYLGPVTVYSHLQACGIINDHAATCPCYSRIVEHYPCVQLPADGDVVP